MNTKRGMEFKGGVTIAARGIGHVCMEGSLNCAEKNGLLPIWTKRDWEGQVKRRECLGQRHILSSQKANQLLKQ